MPKTETSKEKAKITKQEATVLPAVTAPADRYSPQGNRVAVRFTYVPSEGLYAGTASTWYLARERHFTSEALRKNPKLARWLTANPLAVVYGHLYENDLKLTSIYAGGDWWPDDEARKMTPGLEWIEPDLSVV